MKAELVSLMVVATVLVLTSTFVVPSQCSQEEENYRLDVTDNEAFLIIGRYYNNGANIQFDWSGVSIAFTVGNVTGFTIGMIDDGNEYNVFANGTLITVFTTSSGIENYSVELGNADEVYDVLIFKRTEALFGVVTVTSFSFTSSPVFYPPAAPFNSSRRIEFIGDSITCGYGDLGVPPCPFTNSTENNYVSYGPLTARQLNADLHLEAWSGKGVVRNYGAPNITSTDTIPDLFNRSLANVDGDYWDFSSWIPQAVVINLGTNDYSTQPYPPQNVFESGYIEFIKTIQQYYGTDVNFFLVCGPMISNPCCEYVQNVAQQTGSTFINIYGILNATDYGCNGHPNVDGQYKMYENVYPIIQKQMGWY